MNVVAQRRMLIQPFMVKNAVLARVPKGTEELNLTALEMGFELAEEAKARMED